MQNRNKGLGRFLGDMHIINPEPFLKSFQALSCNETFSSPITSKDFEIKHFETEPLDGFEFQPGFPNCCPNHTHLLKLAEEKFNVFPNCCEFHKNLNNAKWFSKENYSYMPLKFVKTLTYTMDCISKCIENKDWYKEITDYIDYTKRSFGQFPDGYGTPPGLSLYLHNVKMNLQNEKEIPSTKKEKLLAFIEGYFNKEPEIDQTDINILISKYREWIKTFPFDIPFFQHLKPYFEKQIPIISGKGETNIYTGMTAFKLTTQKKLINFLTSTTFKIIQDLNSAKLYKDGRLPNIFEVQKQVLFAKRELEIQELDNANLADRKDYIKLLKKWLAGEKKFLKELKPILEKESSILSMVSSLIDGMKELQSTDINAHCIVNVRQDGPNKETEFRYWFKNYLSGRYPEAVLSAEEEKGKGRIDLKVTHKLLGTKIIEFKGWWNYKKKNTAEQLCSYLTDFEKEGYIIMINHLNEDISEKYKELTISPAMKYIENSWKDHKVENTDVSYFESKHKFSIKEKTIFHLIFNVNFSNPLTKNSK